MTSNISVTMPQIERIVKFWKCTRCHYEWHPRMDDKPKTCPKCRSPYWDSPRKNKKKEGKK